MGLFSGLEKYGLAKMKDMEVFDAKTNPEVVRRPKDPLNKKEESVKDFNEGDYLFDKSFICPVCSTSFRAKQVRTGKVKLKKSDTDLRPVYEKVDCIKYDAILCPKCGYASMTRFFKYVLPGQAKLVLENITASFPGIDYEKESMYSYDIAIDRYKLALASCVIKKAKASEKAYTCLKLAWVLRGKAESLSEDEPDYDGVIFDLRNEEMELLQNACDGFSGAYEKEPFPICGMDELTFSYMLCDLCRRVGRTDEAKRWISKVLTSRGASERIKDKARYVKELLQEEEQNKI